MAALKWQSFPFPSDEFIYAGAALKKQWARLHRGDCEPFPADKQAQEAWRLYHQGAFQSAYEIGSQGGEGLTAAAKALAIHAAALLDDERAKMDAFQAAMKLAESAQVAMPDNPNGYYFYAMAAGRYGQTLSIAKALSEGLAGKIKEALDKTLALAPDHAEAHIAYGSYHAEIVGKVGGMMAGLTYGASKDKAVSHFERALALMPDSAVAKIEYANALISLFGNKKMDQATQLYNEAAEAASADAMERLDQQRAADELED
ncbi:tetratricopeptide (TPR) repeat protein [Chitinivorax tropicus]|uniref:Tetratricopeptide (TPR) repeat protein n=1 Tax=Chitinivorax tropicus TaxID=714531 RepID=A0A840MM40_9PROT|nr:hypothetical protein [Chitinivorax tropicus]MBB5019698.1 tetratricopeptide (TPR) repeat protein [Chitinivorax tropicus]